jgi:hypothetical protein
MGVVIQVATTVLHMDCRARHHAHGRSLRSLLLQPNEGLYRTCVHCTGAGSPRYGAHSTSQNKGLVHPVKGFRAEWTPSTRRQTHIPTHSITTQARQDKEKACQVNGGAGWGSRQGKATTGNKA